MAFREVRVYEVREVLRLWLDGEGFRSIERMSAVDVVADPRRQFALPHERAVIEHEERHYGTSFLYQLTTRVRAGGARPASLSLFSAREFSDRDVQLLDLLQPFVATYLRLFTAHRGSRSVDASWGLTSREREVLDHVAAGMTNRQIAVVLRISPDTVRKHLKHIYGKLDVPSRTAALARTGRANIT